MELISTGVIKLLHGLATPLGLMALILCVLVLLKLLRIARFRGLLTTLFLLLFCLTTMPLPAQYLARWQSSFIKYENIHPQTSFNYDAIVVAGWSKAMDAQSKDLDTFWSERLWGAMQAHKLSGKPIIVVSTQYPVPTTPNETERTYAQHTLVGWGVGEASIIQTNPSKNTYYAMRSAYQAANKLNASSLLLVGYAYRLPRKKLSLLKHTQSKQPSMQVQALVVNPNSLSHSRDVNELGSWLPNSDTLAHTTELVHELSGLLAYKINGWLGKQTQ